MISVLPARQPGEIDADMLVAVYEMALEDLPGWAIMAAAKELARTQTFRPAPAELRQAALAEIRHESEMAKVRGKPDAIPTNRHISGPSPTRDEIDRLNAHCASIGLSTRYNYDGTERSAESAAA